MEGGAIVDVECCDLSSELILCFKWVARQKENVNLDQKNPPAVRLTGSLRWDRRCDYLLVRNFEAEELTDRGGGEGGAPGEGGGAVVVEGFADGDDVAGG